MLSRMTDTPTFDVTSDDSDFESDDSVLVGLEAELQKEVSRPLIEIPVPDREGVSVVFDPNFRVKTMQRWYKQAGSESRKGLDTIHFATIVIAQTVHQIKFNGQVAEVDGVPLNFVSSKLLQMVDADSAVPEGVVRFYGGDTHLQAVAAKIIEAAGFTEDVDALDPTLGLSAG
jgi:hypothetical protein